MSSRSAPELSLVVPAYNEATALQPLIDVLLPIARSSTSCFELIIVNDGSTDDTLTILQQLQQRVPELCIVDLSRNFGKEAALTAGLAQARGRCAVVLDADLQDPPELLPTMLQKWREGYETVVAVHRERSGDSRWRRGAARWFYRVINAVSEVPMLADAGDFRLLDRAVIDAFLSLPERARFNKGLFAWLGFRQYVIEHARPLRSQGASKFTAGRLFGLALDGLTSFSSFPLRLWVYAGFIIASLALAYGAFIVLRTLLFGVDVPGYASLIVAVIFLGGVNLLSVGVLGEYIGRIFMESKQRPIYIVRRVHAAPRDAGSGPTADPAD